MTDTTDLSNLEFPQGTPDAERTLPATRLSEWVHQNRKPLSIRGAIIEGPIDLAAVNYAHELTVQDSTFRGKFDLRDARFGKSVDLCRCTFEHNVNFSGCRVDGSLLLTEATIQGGTSPGAPANFDLLRLQGNLSAEGLLSGVQLSLPGARVAGFIDLTGAVIAGGLDLQVAVLDGSLHCGSLTLRSGGGVSGVDDGSALLGGIRVAGQVTFGGAHIARDLVLYSADIRCGLRCRPDQGRRTDIGGNALLGAAKVAFGVDFSGARVQGTLNLEDADIDGQLTCAGVSVQGGAPGSSDWQTTEVVGQVALSGLLVSGETDLSGMTAQGGLDLASAQLKGGLVCGPSHQHRSRFSGLSLSAARVGVKADFQAAQVQGDLNLQNAVVEGDLLCHATEVSAPGGHVLLNGVKVSGRVSLNGARVVGDVNLQSAEIKGGLFCRPLEDSGPVSEGSRTRIGRHLVLAPATVAGGIHLEGLDLAGDLNLDALAAEGGLACTPWRGGGTQPGVPLLLPARIGGRATLAAASISGVVDFGGADVHGDLNLPSSDLRNGLVCHSADAPTLVGGTLSLAAAKVAGMADLRGMHVAGDLILEGAVVEGKVTCSVADGRRTNIGGNAALGGVKVSGAVGFGGAVVGHNLNLRGAIIEGKLGCQQAEVGGDVLLAEMKVSGQIDLSNLVVRQGLNLQGAEIDGALICRATRVGGIVDLVGCSVRNAQLDVAALKEPPPGQRPTRPTVRLEGFQFQDLALGDRACEGEYLGLLAAAETFEVSTYFAIERWLRNQGKDEEANDIYLAMRAERRQPGRMPAAARPIDWLFDIPIWLAMHYKWLFLGFVVSLILSTGVFYLPGALRPRQADERPPEGVTAAPSWTLVDAFWMSLQMNLPMTHIPAADRWELTTRPITLGSLGLPIHYDAYGSLVSLLGYLGVPLFLGGVAGTWLRRRDASD